MEKEKVINRKSKWFKLYSWFVLIICVVAISLGVLIPVKAVEYTTQNVWHWQGLTVYSELPDGSWATFITPEDEDYTETDGDLLETGYRYNNFGNYDELSLIILDFVWDEEWDETDVSAVSLHITVEEFGYDDDYEIYNPMNLVIVGLADAVAGESYYYYYMDRASYWASDDVMDGTWTTYDTDSATYIVQLDEDDLASKAYYSDGHGEHYILGITFEDHYDGTNNHTGDEDPDENQFITFYENITDAGGDYYKLPYLAITYDSTEYGGISGYGYEAGVSTLDSWFDEQTFGVAFAVMLGLMLAIWYMMRDEDKYLRLVFICGVPVLFVANVWIDLWLVILMGILLVITGWVYVGKRT